MRMLVSVRSVDEALLAGRAGVDFIDLKEPDLGALGGLPVGTIRQILAALRAAHIATPVSATIGDVPTHAHDEIATRVAAVGACGVDVVKVGVEPGPAALALLDRLAASGWPIVPVFIADRGLDAASVAHAARLPFAGLMVDTADKRAGSLFEVAPRAALQAFVATARASGRLAGLAGALRLEDAGTLAALAPDFAGFRSAVCDGDRRGALDVQRLHALAAALRAAQASSGRTSPSSSERIQASSLL
jgi:uncharacterized protein (UPF0264 family)